LQKLSKNKGGFRLSRSLTKSCKVEPHLERQKKFSDQLRVIPQPVERI